ncbi:SPBc2 prophage-derived glycosyltransferase SunS [Streptomyces griseorubiginosus]|uniref:SPBc2 prophage-derived glycosyltransferase SunS n=1 Tax=Streptomyces griseorubiginosus TaxID=67304 RepID=A0AAI8PQM4_9ACTN|nr:SPBc2 prophage-derived glycosyltransferase SunS [Streptomyces griseorubiginosus]
MRRRRATVARVKQQTLCLCMIVKNESRVIERCLSAVRPFIDYWVIDDTGSTDGTQDLIRKVLDGVPGELHEEPWVDFGHNRTRNIQRAEGQADYLLTLDADHVLRQDAPLPRLTADSYMLRYDVPGTQHRFKHLLRGDRLWRYEGVTHEYPCADEPDTQENLDALVVEDHADGGCRSDKFERDARLLRRELGRDPGNPRTVFYLANTERDLGHPEEAIALYEQRAAMGGWGEEVYCSLLEAGILRAETADDWPAAMDTFSRAWDARPQRLEACYELAAGLRLRGRHHTAHALLGRVVGQPEPEDLLFTRPWVYRWGLLFEFSITAHWVGEYEAAVRACDRLLALPDLPDTIRAQTVINRQFSVPRVPAPSSPAHRRSKAGKGGRKR